MNDKRREIMAETELILEHLFFSLDPTFKALMDENIKPFFNDREDQIRVLLGIFALKEREHQYELHRMRTQFMDSLLVPQAGEVAH